MQTTKRPPPLAHRNVLPLPFIKQSSTNLRSSFPLRGYGVPAHQRLLPPGHFNRFYALINRYLQSLDLTPNQANVTLQLIHLYTYYGKTYPKANQFSDQAGCSKRTFWRAIAKLEQLQVIERINRYLNHLQISNLYRLDKLILILARLIAEQGHNFTNSFTRQILKQTDGNFWRTIWTHNVRLRDPIPII